MKRTLCFLFALASALAASAETLYVTARICPLMSEPSASAKLVAALPQGAKLELVSEKGEWRSIKEGTRSGWVQRMFVGAAPSQAKVQKASDVQNIAALVERRRASSFETSAAATRGLTASSRGRDNVAYAKYDFGLARWLDSLVIADGESERLASRLGFLPEEGSL